MHFRHEFVGGELVRRAAGGDTVAVGFRYDRDRLAALDQVAREAGKTRSKVLREAADAYIAAAGCSNRAATT